ncbi:7-cyano-7-deazaguanine synthase QueC [Chrysiogenes arsenatis]|uniref:7-cyano-7-deazaguanine synthase QueC n=1 Tax=Chrysiogenes arsenatis TaxID=309797 RepID=UPI000402DD88|nr:7-cyano-7-deazaguanine synthase QueC [Chrysiogenes arsenatis]
MSDSRAIALLSGGLDSTVALWLHLREHPNSVALALTFDYGQQAAPREMAASNAIAKHVGVPHQIIPLPFLAEVDGSGLHSGKIPDDVDINSSHACHASAKAVWVPNRNGLFINIAAAYAEALQCTQIIVGFNAEEAVTFPDNSEEFLAAANDALRYSTLQKVRVTSATKRMNKTDIMRELLESNIPTHLLWSCYRGSSEPCGTCESCLRFQRALQEVTREI